MEGDLKLSPALGVGGHGVGVVPKLPGRHKALEGGEIAHRFRGIEAAAHGTDIRDGTADGLRGQGQRKAVPRLQKLRLRLHQSLPHRPVGSLAHIATLGVL